MKKVRIIFYGIALLSATFASFLSFETESLRGSNSTSRSSSRFDQNSSVSVSVDSGKDGGAAGFAILSGLALVAASITFLKKDS